jgi:hypothetical protein
MGSFENGMWGRDTQRDLSTGLEGLNKKWDLERGRTGIQSNC